MLAVGLTGMALAMLCLRLGWRRQRWLVALGWALAVAASVMLAARWDMWGLSVAILAGMTAALLLLTREGVVPPVVSRPMRARATVIAPRWRVEGLARRTAVLLLVVPIGFAATELLALGAEAAAWRAGWLEANSTVLALMMQPIAWAVLASVQMLAAHPRGMIPPALLCALAGGLLWWL